MCLCYRFTQQRQQPSYSHLSRTTRMSRYQKKHSLTHTSPNQLSFINFLHLLWSIASFQFIHVLDSLCTTSLQVIFGLPLGLAPSNSYSIHFCTQSSSSFHNTCPHHRNLFCCSTKIMSSNPSLALNSLLGTLSFTLMPHIHLTILISVCHPPILWQTTSELWCLSGGKRGDYQNCSVCIV